MAVVPRLTCEWARLREVIVGRPHYRLPKPLPPEQEALASPQLWKRAKVFEGMTMAEAMPTAYARCRSQMDAVVRMLRARGVRVHRVPAFLPREEAWLADSFSESLLFFPRDLLLVAGTRLVEVTPCDPRRRRERFPLGRLLARRFPEAYARRVTMPDLDPPHRRGDESPLLDGGDCLVAGSTIFVGISEGGSTIAGAEWLRRRLGKRWVVYPMTFAAEFPHLDCALCLVRPGLGLYCPEALPQGPPPPLSDWTWIEVSKEDALRGMATNGLQLDETTLLLPESAAVVGEALRGFGHRVETVPFDAVTAFGGGLRCWSQSLGRW